MSLVWRWHLPLRGTACSRGPLRTNGEHIRLSGFGSHAEADFLIRLPRPVRANADRDGLIQPLEELQQLVGGEAAEMPVHQVRHFRLLDAKQGDDFLLPELPGQEQLMDVESQLCPSIKLVAILKPEIGEDVAGAYFMPHVGMPAITHVPLAPLPLCIAV